MKLLIYIYNYGIIIIINLINNFLKMMYLTIKQKLKHLSKDEYLTLKELSHIAKDLTNQAIYNMRQNFFNKKYLSYQENYQLLKNSENYKLLNSNIAQQLIKEVDGSFKSFFSLLKLKKKGKYNEKIKLPNYLKKDGFATLIIGFVRLKDDYLIIPYSNNFKKNHNLIKIKLPTNLKDKKIKEIRIIPKSNARFFEIQYSYEVELNQSNNLDNTQALSLDLGVSNFATAVSTYGKSFIVDGRKLKSIIQWFNKNNARLQSIKDKQKLKYTTKQQLQLSIKRINKVNDYISKAAKYIIDYCIKNDIGNLVCGFNVDLQKSSNLGKQNNQNLINMPFGLFRDKLEYLCKLNGIIFTKQEESYTSQASFFDNDDIPTYDKNNYQHYSFSGKRIKRGLYKSKNNKIINADVNGALNILKKSKVVSLNGLYNSGEVNTPIRIRNFSNFL